MARSYEKERQVYLIQQLEQTLLNSLADSIIDIVDDHVRDSLDMGLAKKSD